MVKIMRCQFAPLNKKTPTGIVIEDRDDGAGEVPRKYG